MISLRTRCSCNRIEIPKPIVVEVHQKRTWLFTINDRFVELRMVLLDQKNVYAARIRRRLFTVAGCTHKPINVNHSVNMPILLSLSDQLHTV